MRLKGGSKAFRENTAITYRPPTRKAPETPLSRELGVLERQMNGRFREGSIFEGGQRGTPHPMPIDIFPRSWDNFNIWHNIHRREGSRPDLWKSYSHARMSDAASIVYIRRL